MNETRAEDWNAADGPRVIVTGGGIAGMTAALHLAKSGCRVRLYEEKGMLGGNLASRPIGKYSDQEVYIDVYPHMYQPWYVNFWQLMKEVKVDRQRDFWPFRCFFQLRKGEFPRFAKLEDAYSASHLAQNLFSGVALPADMLVFGYAGLDLLAERLNPTVRLANMSLSGFLNARPYMTRGALDAYETFITRIWAIPSYLASLEDCRTYLTFCFPTGDEPSWLTVGPATRAFLTPLREALEEAGVSIEPETRIEKVVCDERGVSRIELQNTEFQGQTEGWVGMGKPYPLNDPWEYLVLAVPPATLVDLTRNGERPERIVDREPQLAKLKRLGSQAVPMLHLCFNDKLEGLPSGPVGLFGSDLNLAFTDISQSWEGDNRFYKDHTVLAVSCSEPTKLIGPPTANGHRILQELAKYLDFDPGEKWGASPDIRWDPTFDPDEEPPRPDDVTRTVEEAPPHIDWPMTRYHENADAKLSLNAIGTEDCRPKAWYETIPNLVIAGDFCQHYVGMTTVEAAVVSGLAAAREICTRMTPAKEIEILEPETWPEELYLAARYAWAPAIFAAKAWALAAGEWQEATPPVDVGGGRFGAYPREPWSPPRPGEDEPFLRYLLTPGLPPRRRGPGARS